MNTNHFYPISASTVPTLPRNLNVEFLHEDPPQVQITWQHPMETHGKLAGYKVFWGRRGEKYSLVNLGPTRHAYISDVLGTCSCIYFIAINV